MMIIIRTRVVVGMMMENERLPTTNSNVQKERSFQRRQSFKGRQREEREVSRMILIYPTQTHDNNFGSFNGLASSSRAVWCYNDKRSVVRLRVFRVTILHFQGERKNDHGESENQKERALLFWGKFSWSTCAQTLFTHEHIYESVQK